MTFDPSILSPSSERRANGIRLAHRQAPVSNSDGDAVCLQIAHHSFWFRNRICDITSVMRRFDPQGVVPDTGDGSGCWSSSTDRQRPER
jgi:hypothetical protein